MSLRFAVEVAPLEARSLITESLGVAYSIAQLGSYRVGVSPNVSLASISPPASSVPPKSISGRSPRVAVAMPTTSAQEAPVAVALKPGSVPAPESLMAMEADPTGIGFVAPPSRSTPGGGPVAHAPIGGEQTLSSSPSLSASRHPPEADNPAAAISATAFAGASSSTATTGVAFNTPVAGQNTSAVGSNALAPATAPVSLALTSAYAPIAPATRRPAATPMLSSLSFTNFPLYTLDYNNGETLLPGASQYANLNGYVDLRAQTKSATGVTFSWNTSGLTDAKNITGTSSYRLQFQWKNFSSGATDTVTLTATDSGGHQETQTYSFIVPSGSVFPWGSSPTYSWPEAVSPDQALADTPRFDSHNVSVDGYSGAVETAIALPSYNPNVVPLVFSYDSLNADPRPMILEHHELDPSQSVPSKVGAQLTFNSSTGTTYYYDTSAFSGGDIMQMALQANATSLSTGRYDYSVAVSDVRGSTTTTTASGTMTVLNGSSSAVGAGWTLNGLERITAASGGLILDLGANNKSLWFTGSGTGTYTSPAGEFSTLVKNYDNTYTRTLTDGLAIHFDTGGREVSVTDLNGLSKLYAYDSSGRISTVTDPYGQATTLAYDVAGKIATVTDPASRVTTFTHSGSKLSGVTLPDSSAWSFAYDSANRLTGVTDPRSKTVTVTLDGAGRASSVSRPDGTSESFAPYQKQGYDTSGTSGSPAAATLLAESKATYTDPNSGTTDHRVDWRGQGLSNQVSDAAGHVTTLDRDSNGLATVAIDRLNRASLATYLCSEQAKSEKISRNLSNHAADFSWRTAA